MCELKIVLLQNKHELNRSDLIKLQTSNCALNDSPVIKLLTHCPISNNRGTIKKRTHNRIDKLHKINSKTQKNKQKLITRRRLLRLTLPVSQSVTHSDCWRDKKGTIINPSTAMEVMYSSDSCDSDSRDEKTIDLSNLELPAADLQLELQEQRKSVAHAEIILLNSNRLTSLNALQLAPFHQLRVLNLSGNHLTCLPEQILALPTLTTLIARNNKFTNESLPKSFLIKGGGAFREINLAGNLFTHFPEQLLELPQLKYLYLGGNTIPTIPKDVWRMRSLVVLSMPGNRLTEIPEAVGSLHQLQALILNDNGLERIPGSVAMLSSLKSLYLHKNRLKHLPRDIITLRNLIEVGILC